MSISDFRWHVLWLLMLLVAAVTTAFAQSGPSLGELATQEEVEKWDISIAPDGLTLPSGEGSARRGEEVYQKHCLRCHGEGAEGGDGLADPLVGGIGSLASGEHVIKTVGSYWPYATTIFDYVRRAMPYDLPMSLSNDDVYAVTAYLLALNDIIEPTETLNSMTLPDVVMPNHDGFVFHWPESN